MISKPNTKLFLSAEKSAELTKLVKTQAKFKQDAFTDAEYIMHPLFSITLGLILAYYEYSFVAQLFGFEN